MPMNTSRGEAGSGSRLPDRRAGSHERARPTWSGLTAQKLLGRLVARMVGHASRTGTPGNIPVSGTFVVTIAVLPR